MEGVVNEVPVKSNNPPTGESYHFTVPVHPVEPSVTDPAPHLVAGIPVTCGL